MTFKDSTSEVLTAELLRFQSCGIVSLGKWLLALCHWASGCWLFRTQGTTHPIKPSHPRGHAHSAIWQEQGHGEETKKYTAVNQIQGFVIRWCTCTMMVHICGVLLQFLLRY